MIRLGSTVRDMVSGFNGIACAKTDVLNGNVQIGIQPKVGESNQFPESLCFDIQTVEVIDAGLSDKCTDPDPTALAFDLGTKVRDMVTGVEGILTSRTVFLNGCVQYGIRPRAGHYSKEFESGLYVDWNHIERVGAGILPKIAQSKKAGLFDRLFSKDKPKPTPEPEKRITGGPVTRLIRAT